MRQKGIGLVFGLLYCFPFVYFAMLQDFRHRSLLGYFVMIAATSLLAYFGKRFSSLLWIIVGNLLSALISYYFIGTAPDVERWNSYFKPLTPTQFVIFVSVLNGIPQILAALLANRHRNAAKT